jgi:polyisoprenoid-binding protein YceI
MATTKWVLDPSHSEVSFKVKHLMVTNVSGSFNTFSVAADTANGDDFTNAVVEFSADTSSISTNSEQRDEHLKSADFFDAANFPQITFKATRLEKKVSDGDFELTGNLTIKGVTKSVKLNAEFGGVVKDPWGNTKAGFTVTGKFNRKDFGLTWNAALETGGVMVSEEVRINTEIQLIKQA